MYHKKTVVLNSCSLKKRIVKNQLNKPPTTLQIHTRIPSDALVQHRHVDVSNTRTSLIDIMLVFINDFTRYRHYVIDTYIRVFSTHSTRGKSTGSQKYPQVQPNKSRTANKPCNLSCVMIEIDVMLFQSTICIFENLFTPFHGVIVTLVIVSRFKRNLSRVIIQNGLPFQTITTLQVFLRNVVKNGLFSGRGWTRKLGIYGEIDLVLNKSFSFHLT